MESFGAVELSGKEGTTVGFILICEIVYCAGRVDWAVIRVLGLSWERNAPSAAFSIAQ